MRLTEQALYAISPPEWKAFMSGCVPEWREEYYWQQADVIDFLTIAGSALKQWCELDCHSKYTAIDRPAKIHERTQSISHLQAMIEYAFETGDVANKLADIVHPTPETPTE